MKHNNFINVKVIMNYMIEIELNIYYRYQEEYLYRFLGLNVGGSINRKLGF